MNTRDESQRRRCLKRWRRPRIAGILISGIGLWGCTPEPSSAKRLPDPDRWRVPLPVFDAEQQQRKDEVDQYLALRYQEAGWSIIATIQTYEGDVMDWVDPLTGVYSGAEGSDIAGGLAE